MKRKLVYFFLLAAVLTACTKDVIVKDIKGKSLVVNAPADNMVTTSNQVTFWWQELDGAEQYNVQIVQPSFNAITKLVADTDLYATKFNVILQPGMYQWRIKAFNNGGGTAYQTYNLRVDTSSNLSGQLISIIAPANAFLTGSSRLVFSWNPLNSATTYQFMILNSNSGIVKDTITSLTTYTTTLPPTSASYVWKVRALNNTSVSQYNSPFTFTVDRTAPAVSTPTAPMGSSSFPAVVTLSNTMGWTRIGAPDTRYDSVYVATDSLFLNTFSKTMRHQTSIKISELNNPPTANATYYWWRLRSIDSVGNCSVFSGSQKFKLNP